MAPGKHSKIGASSSKRWMTCPGSVQLSEGIQDTTSIFAMEGTAAHQLAEDCLVDMTHPMDMIGGTVTVEDDDGQQVEFPINEDMAEAVSVYVNEARRLFTETGGTPNVEMEFCLDWIDSDLFGTNDLSVGQMFGTLHVLDYKHGKGVVVEAMGNTQLLIYALGAMGKDNQNGYTHVQMTIVQPRAWHEGGPIRSWRISVAELQQWATTMLVTKVAATREPNAHLEAGDHCRFCRAKGVCPKIGQEVIETSGLSADQVFSSEALTLPAPSELTPMQRAKLYDFCAIFEAWMKQVRKDTHDRMLNGEEIPGLKVVAGRASRGWINKEEAAKELVKLVGVDVFNTTIKTPAQVEKVLPGKKLEKAAIAHLVATTRGSTIASASDKRPALHLEGAAEAFNSK